MKQKRRWLIPLLLLLLLAAGVFAFISRARVARWLSDRAFLRERGFARVRSGQDADGDGLEDFGDMLEGARAFIATNPEYKSEYYAGGYPPEGEGVCTDVLWHALAAAGYDLKAMVDEDVAAHRNLYPLENGWSDPNIDFRRVNVLKVFFERSGCLRLTTDPADLPAWQPGDIVFYEGHVALVSDRKGESGEAQIVHLAGYGPREEDNLRYKAITGHFRWTFPEGPALPVILLNNE